ncbi:hypothetical protein Ancab_029087 [Ancistrocladus abbreviatus]
MQEIGAGYFRELVSRSFLGLHTPTDLFSRCITASVTWLVMYFKKLVTKRIWWDYQLPRTFALLEELYLNHCPQLIGGLPCGVSLLKRLEIDDCSKLDLASLVNFSGLISLKLGRVNIEPLDLDPLQELEELDVLHPAAGLLPLCLQLDVPITSLKTACFSSPPETKDNSTLISDRVSLPSMENVTLVWKGGLPANLHTLCSKDCGLLMNLNNWPLRSLVSLEHLEIKGASNVHLFPERYLLPTTLTHLCIENFHDLKIFSGLELQRSCRLEELKISNCKGAKFEAKEHKWEIPRFLCSLEIYGCPLLEESFRRELE